MLDSSMKSTDTQLLLKIFMSASQDHMGRQHASESCFSTISVGGRVAGGWMEFEWHSRLSRPRSEATSFLASYTAFTK
jgi:hypothetical protein